MINPFDKFVKKDIDPNQKVIMIEAPHGDGNAPSLAFLRKLKSIDYDSIKEIDPTWKGLITEIKKKAHNPFTGEVKDIVEQVKAVDKFQLIDVLVSVTKELDDELINLKIEDANKDVVISKQNNEIRNLKEKIENYDAEMISLKAQMDTMMEKITIANQTSFLLKERLDVISEGCYVHLGDDIASSQYVFK